MGGSAACPTAGSAPRAPSPGATQPPARFATDLRQQSHQKDMFTELQKLGQPFTFELYSVQGDVVLPSSVPVAYSGDGEPHVACKAEHLILHQWDFAMNAALNADYGWEQLQDIWPQLGDVHTLPACASSSREASRASSRRTLMAGDV
jgi:hypothetical protein